MAAHIFEWWKQYFIFILDSISYATHMLNTQKKNTQPEKDTHMQQ